MKTLSIFLFLILCTATFAVSGLAGPYHVKVRTDPEVVNIGRARLLIEIRDAQGKPVSGATVKTMTKMPDMNMGEREETAVPAATPGDYSAPAVFAMAGAYEVQLSITGPQGSGKVALPLATGQSSTSGPSGIPWFAYLIGLAALTGVVIWRMKATGQKVHLGGIFTGKVIWSLVMLGAALGAATWAVRNLRREGAMTPLEAQVMEMNTPAPEGTLPVVLAAAEMKPFEETVTYSGQVVGLVEQEVVPRVTGTILSMSVYVGDHVKKGQVLARLDTRQLDPMVAERAAGVNSASQGVSVATSEYEQSLNMLQQTRAEISMAESEVSEAKSMLDAARATKTSAEAGVESANAEAKSALADLASAQADAEFQQKEVERVRSLFDQGFVSGKEMQRAQADLQKAIAAVNAAREQSARQGAMVREAKSEVVRATAEIAAASTRVTKAQANLKAKLAQVATAQSGVATARAKIGQSRAAVDEANAGLSGASVQKQFAEIRAEVDGVVTQRLISPGVVVNPGQTILKIAQVSSVRLQANVPQQDLARIKVGNIVRARASRDDKNPVMLTVTSVSPSVDPSSRMGSVEAIFDNAGAQFSPGQYVSLEISIGRGASKLVIPANAIQQESRGMETANYVWVATPSMGGASTVRRQEITIEGRAADFVSVLSGLKQGDKVVVAPSGLAAGSSVRPIDAPVADLPTGTQIEITAEGFVPASIQIKAGTATKLTFLRKVDETCATEVDFKGLGIHAELPLNVAVTIEIPAQPAGKVLPFACAMDMIKGRVVVQ